MAASDVMAGNTELSSKVFSSVMATLSATLVETLPSVNKDLFLTEFVQSERAAVYSDQASNTFCISGNLEQIIQCQAKLSRLILDDSACRELWEGVTRACEGIRHLFQIDEGVKRHDIGITCDILASGPRKFLKDESSELENMDADNDDFYHEANNEDDKVSSTGIMYGVTDFGHKAYMKKQLTGRDSPPEDSDSDFEDEKASQPVVSTKRGRIIKRPAKLENSVVQYVKKGCVQADDGGQDGHHKRESLTRRKVGRPRKYPLVQNLDKPATLAIVEQTGMDEEGNTVVDEIKDEGHIDELDENLISKEDGVKNKLDKKAAGIRDVRKFYEDRLPFKFFCDICSFKTKRESHFENHRNLHLKNPDMLIFQCSKCDFKTLRRSVLQRHSVSHESATLQCRQCPYQTNVKLQLKNHLRKHKRKSLADMVGHLKCEQCSFQTLSKSKLMDHVQTHAMISHGGDRRFHCNQCQYKTTRLMLMRRHQATVHTDRRPYLCDYCGAAFKRTDALAQHKMSHLDRSKRNLPFVCAHCKKGFKSKCHLLEHMSVHSTMRAFQCHICGNMFKTKAIQRRHQQIVHFNPGKLKCERCDKTFKTKYAKQRHALAHDIHESRSIQSGLTEGQNAVGDGQGQIAEGEGQLGKDGTTVDEAADENVTAIQTITIGPESLTDFTQQLQTVSAQLQSGSDVGEVYIQGLEHIDSGMISLVNMGGDNNMVRHIFVPPASQEGTTEMLDDGQIKQLYIADKPELSTVNLSSNDQLKEVLVSSGSGPDYVKHIFVQSTAADSGDRVQEYREILIGSDQNPSGIKQILIPASSESDSTLVNQAVLQLSDSVQIQNKNIVEGVEGQLIEQSQTEEPVVEVVDGEQTYQILKDDNGQTLLTLNPAAVDDIPSE